MAEYKFAAALNASTFPLVTRFQPRSVMIGQLDGKLRNPAAVYNDLSDNNPSNIPQVIYCENIMPTPQGCKTVGFVNLQAVYPGAGSADDVFTIRNGGTQAWFFSPAEGMNYVTAALGAPWVSTNPLAGAPLLVSTPQVSVAEVNGISYVCYFGTKLLQWNGAAFVDAGAALIGIVATSIRSICSSGNYLVVMYSDNSVKWSSLTNPLDFTPSTASGAGSQIPIDMRGAPLYLSQIAGGFLIHCSENTVAAVYTQNVAQPWIFREVKNSGGMLFTDNFAGVSRQSSTGTIYMYGTSGLQSLNLRDCDIIHPQVTEFFAGRLLEVFNGLTNLLSVSLLTRFSVKLAFINNRYLCLSYGSTFNQYNYALIYDAALKRWGKLKADHTCIFNNPSANSQSDMMLMLRMNGSCDLVNLDDRVLADNGVLILGRYQLSRTSKICSEEIELEVQDANDTPTVDILANFTGTITGFVTSMLPFESGDNYRSFQKQIEAENISFVIKGTFNLTSVLITCTKGAATNS